MGEEEKQEVTVLKMCPLLKVAHIIAMSNTEKQLLDSSVYSSLTYCKEEECAWWNEQDKECCVRAIDRSIDALIVGAET